MPEIRQLGSAEDAGLRALLEASGLPVSDLAESRPVLFGTLDDAGLVGVVGVEVHGHSGLLRSLAVRSDARGTGLGGALVEEAEQFARARGIRHLYLLTDTAEKFFARRGYRRVERAVAPPEISGTSEFASLCPSTSGFMVKDLDARRYRVLILCTGNSARSQIAEALLATRGGARFEVASAGSRPASAVNPWAVRVLAEAGIPWVGRMPKGLEGLDRERWDFVITVCDRAREACPILPGAPVLAHWGMPDPAEVDGGEDEKLRAFRDTLVTLGRRIDMLLALPLEKLDRLALASRIRGIAGA
jgi:protein-tyrosine-phosphatase/N-acetylglutamate synthase-like GNAT family acetyltransferase